MCNGLLMGVFHDIYNFYIAKYNQRNRMIYPPYGSKLGSKKQDEAHEPECSHVC